MPVTSGVHRRCERGEGRLDLPVLGRDGAVTSLKPLPGAGLPRPCLPGDDANAERQSFERVGLDGRRWPVAWSPHDRRRSLVLSTSLIAARNTWRFRHGTIREGSQAANPLVDNWRGWGQSSHRRGKAQL